MPIHFRNVQKIFFWEFLQNLSLLLGFSFALHSAQKKMWLGVVLFSLFGSFVGSLTIRYTEHKIVPGEVEPLKVTLTNLVGFFIIAVCMAVYFAQAWGSWQLDVLWGVIFGVLVGYSQDLAAQQKKPGIRHILALTLAFVPALLAIRFFTGLFPPFWSAIFLNTLITSIIVWVDYLKPALLQPSQNCNSSGSTRRMPDKKG